MSQASNGSRMNAHKTKEAAAPRHQAAKTAADSEPAAPHPGKAVYDMANRAIADGKAVVDDGMAVVLNAYSSVQANAAAYTDAAKQTYAEALGHAANIQENARQAIGSAQGTVKGMTNAGKERIDAAYAEVNHQMEAARRFDITKTALFDLVVYYSSIAIYTAWRTLNYWPAVWCIVVTISHRLQKWGAADLAWEMAFYCLLLLDRIPLIGARISVIIKTYAGDVRTCAIGQVHDHQQTEKKREV